MRLNAGQAKLLSNVVWGAWFTSAGWLITTVRIVQSVLAGWQRTV
jgi:hypothetical protein